MTAEQEDKKPGESHGGSTATSNNKPKEKKEKPVNPNIVIPPKKPKLSKAERRALQEAQRAAKAAAGGGGGGGKSSPHGGNNNEQKKKHHTPAAAAAAAASNKQHHHTKGGSGAAASTAASASSEEKSKVLDPAMVKSFSSFSHLQQYRDPSDIKIGSEPKNLPHQVLQLGRDYAEGKIWGSNARCQAMLRCFQQVLTSDEYHPSPDVKDLRSDFDHSILKPSFQYWTTKCRPHCVSMGNAFTFVKAAVATLDRDVDLEALKEELVATMDDYMKERIDYAGVAISEYASSKIAPGDVILTFGYSKVVQKVLIDCKDKDISVVCVDSRPLMEGKRLVVLLQEAGIPCTYLLLNALSHQLRRVTKVFLGASALMADGSVLSRIGTACVALLAHSHQCPVLFCCETYKISHRVQLESITGNELGNPDDVSGKDLQDWKQKPNLRLLNLMYDLTPSQFVSGIVTEMGIVPPTSIAVLLREMNPQENGEQGLLVD